MDPASGVAPRHEFDELRELRDGFKHLELLEYDEDVFYRTRRYMRLLRLFYMFGENTTNLDIDNDMEILKGLASKLDREFVPKAKQNYYKVQVELLCAQMRLAGMFAQLNQVLRSRSKRCKIPDRFRDWIAQQLHRVNPQYWKTIDQHVASYGQELVERAKADGIEFRPPKLTENRVEIDLRKPDVVKQQLLDCKSKLEDVTVKERRIRHAFDVAPSTVSSIIFNSSLLKNVFYRKFGDDIKVNSKGTAESSMQQPDYGVKELTETEEVKFGLSECDDHDAVSDKKRIRIIEDREEEEMAKKRLSSKVQELARR